MLTGKVLFLHNTVTEFYLIVCAREAEQTTLGRVQSDVALQPLEIKECSCFSTRWALTNMMILSKHFEGLCGFSFGIKWFRINTKQQNSKKTDSTA